MKKLLAAAALAALTACATAPTGGPRIDWRCDGGAAYSARVTDAGTAEVFAAGRTYTLPAAGGGRYSDGAVTYSENGDLGGAFGGPYSNCRRS